jgi:hypothetical protein
MESWFVRISYLGRRQALILAQVIRDRDLKLTREIGCGPGYLFHAGEIKGRAVIVKVFTAGPDVREVCPRAERPGFKY